MLSIRKLGVMGRTYRHLNRYRQILQVLFKYGFGDIVDRLRIEQYLDIGLKLISRRRHNRLERLSRPERVRMALEELGPTFVKLGQILSTRPDLIPLAYARELSRLQDHVPAVPYEEIRETFREELNRDPEEVFGYFDPVPLAAASIGQVHRARMPDSEEVIVKIQRPGIKRTVEVDLEILLHLASLMERHLEEFELQRPTRIVEEFAHTLEKEIDYRTEAAHIQRFAKQFLGDSTIYVPKVYREINTERVLTLEFVSGIKVSDSETLQAKGMDLKELARRGAVLFMEQIFVHGFFHADPHPGNIFVLPGNVICLLDFGMMGRISLEAREDFTDLVYNIVKRDPKKIRSSMVKLTAHDREPDPDRLERDLSDLVDRYLFRPLKDLELGRLFSALIEIMTQNGLSIKPDLFLMMKALGTVEGVGRSLDPDFDLFEHADPFIRRVQLNRMNPKRIFSEAMESGSELVRLMQEIPTEMRALFRQAKEGKLKIEFEHMGLDPLIFAHDRTTNRIAFAIVLAALIIGSSLIVLAGVPPLWNDIPIIGLVGYIVAGVMGFWLLITILRRGSM